ncbi:MAG: L,D-transpeptidase family protein [Candidatus Nitricoxidivorans perseverans]|uniref:L,D-transpeptidase family protein n=1 Tax=Candidatus Nitricoxidivorans perseverans TaxID=2975601 RepID=A0AA49FMR8_9PROT|nr:MAG: L,D-transpeptidase family protein [Candidatus Nitricoxidivorans perseverans]
MTTTRRSPGVIAAALSALVLLFASAISAQPRYSDSGPEPLLARVFEQIEQNKWEPALQQLEALIKAYPNFRLAHLIKGDLLLARAKPLKAFGEGSTDAQRDKVADLREEAVARIKAYKNKPAADYIPRYLLQMRTDQEHAVVVDTQKSRLYLYQNDNGTPRFVADYYIAHGKLGADKLREGDKKTPIGVYHVTASLPRQKLADFYGSGAFPISYPNEWDKRMGRNGHGIWLHGTPSDTFSRPPKASDGCVVLANRDLDDLSKSLQIGLTPVIISNSIEWLSLDDWQSERGALLAMIDEWRGDWESMDIDRYARHYSKKFQSGRQDQAGWIEHKRKVNAGKRWIKVEARNISMFRDPGRDEYVVVTFEQDYQSSNLSNVMKKRQYWIKEDGRWKIVSEDAA